MESASAEEDEVDLGLSQPPPCPLLFPWSRAEEYPAAG